MPIEIQNEFLRFQVTPALGARVTSLFDKADGYELLHTLPTPPPAGPQYDQPFVGGNMPGWVECFPAISAGAYPAAPYAGISIPDHGELWSLPTTAVPTQAGITTVWHGLRFGYRFVRKLYLVGPSIVADYTLVNLSPFEFRFVWALHALMSRREPVRFVCDDPATTQPHDVLAGQNLKRFLTSPITEPFGVEYSTRGRTLSIAYSSADRVAAYWGVWIENTAEPHFAIEPTTGRDDALTTAVADGSAGRIAPMATCRWTTRMTVGALSD